MAENKQEVVTFKVDPSLMALLKSIDNRSAFIRNAVLAALDSACPLCRGTGVLSPRQREHWADFAHDHPLKQCDECHEYHLSCSLEP